MSLSVLVSDSNFSHNVNTDDATAVVVHFAFGANIHERKKKIKRRFIGNYKNATNAGRET